MIIVILLLLVCSTFTIVNSINDKNIVSEEISTNENKLSDYEKDNNMRKRKEKKEKSESKNENKTKRNDENTSVKKKKNNIKEEKYKKDTNIEKENIINKKGSIKAKYIILFVIESLTISIILSYLIISKFNKYAFVKVMTKKNILFLSIYTFIFTTIFTIVNILISSIF